MDVGLAKKYELSLSEARKVVSLSESVDIAEATCFALALIGCEVQEAWQKAQGLKYNFAAIYKRQAPPPATFLVLTTNMDLLHCLHYL